jgi:hypothetical protein
MKKRKIETISINDQSKYGQIEEEWVTTDAEGFFEHCMDRESRLSMLKNKINEVIDFLNKN